MEETALEERTSQNNSQDMDDNDFEGRLIYTYMYIYIYIYIYIKTLVVLLVSNATDLMYIFNFQ